MKRPMASRVRRDCCPSVSSLRASSTSLRKAADAPLGWPSSHSQWRGSKEISREITPNLGRPGPLFAGTGSASIDAAPDEDVQERLLVTAPAGDHLSGRVPFRFDLFNAATGKLIATRSSFFWAPAADPSEGTP